MEENEAVEMMKKDLTQQLSKVNTPSFGSLLDPDHRPPMVHEMICEDPDLEKTPPAMKEKMLPAIKEKYDSAKNYLPEDNQIYVKYAGPKFFGDPDAMGVSELLCSKYETMKK